MKKIACVCSLHLSLFFLHINSLLPSTSLFFSLSLSLSPILSFIFLYFSPFFLSSIYLFVFSLSLHLHVDTFLIPPVCVCVLPGKAVRMLCV